MTKKAGDIMTMFADIQVIKETVKRIEEANGKDHFEIKVKQDATNGKVLNNIRRLDTLEDYNKDCEKSKREAIANTKYTFSRNQKIFAVIMVLAQFSVDLLLLFHK